MIKMRTVLKFNLRTVLIFLELIIWLQVLPTKPNSVRYF